MTDTTPLTDVPAEQLDQLIDVGNRALNDYYHERACSCSTWPEKCASWKSPGDMFFGYWDTDAFAIALPDIIAAYEQQKTAAMKQRGPLVACGFGSCNQCEWDSLAELRGWDRHAALGKWYCPTHKTVIVAES